MLAELGLLDADGGGDGEVDVSVMEQGRGHLTCALHADLVRHAIACALCDGRVHAYSLGGGPIPAAGDAVGLQGAAAAVFEVAAG